MKINNIIIFLFLTHNLFIEIFSNYIILPFNTLKKNSSSFLSNTNHYTLLSLGQPLKTVEMYILLNEHHFYLGKGLCRLNSFSDYIPYKSETFKNYSDYSYLINDIKNAANSTDNYFLYINDLNLKKNITVKDMQFYYGTNKIENETFDKEKICGIIGLDTYNFNPEYAENNFVSILKYKNITSSYAFSFIFSNNYNKNIFFSENNYNFLLIGMNETETSNLFNTNDLKIIKAIKSYSYGWSISIDEIFLNYNNLININTDRTSITINRAVNFDNEFDFIIAQTTDFFAVYNYFFKEYLEKNICILNFDSSNKNYSYIFCDSSFKKEMNKLPNINFMIRDINYTFILTYEDLFIEFDQKIYFMLVNDYYHSDYWTFGNLFLKKFPLIFDYDKKTITFINIYNPIINEKNSKFDIKSLLFYIGGGLCIIVGIVFGVIIGKVIWDKNRKKRANELLDDYDYNSNEGNNEKNKIIND